MNLSQHDSRILSAAIGYVLAIAGSGFEGADALNVITDRKARKILTSATDMLARARPELGADDLAPPSGGTFSANLDRLRDIGKGLLGTVESGPVTAVAEVNTIEPIDKEGKVTGPKQYQLWITHEEIHAVYHAITAVDAMAAGDVLLAYEAVKQYEAHAPEIVTFVDKFNQVHEAARKDGEVADVVRD